MKKKSIFFSLIVLISSITGLIQNPANAFHSVLGLSQADKVNLENTGKNIDKLLSKPLLLKVSFRLELQQTCSGCSGACYNSCAGSCRALNGL